ncbi:prosaposin-like [Oscarella lobularis]|uniref:prosaposin-like n=1 Tax=Oscarella lobularis TaxID=121494 RepID=UPI0033136580
MNAIIIVSALVALASARVVNVPKPEGALVCEVCKLVATELKNLVGNGTNVEAALKKVCSELPSELKSECETLVKEYGSEIISIFNSVTPDELCNFIHLCDSARVPVVDLRGSPELVEDNHVESNLTCGLCEKVVGELQSLLKNNSTEEAVIDALNKVCNLMPSSISSECSQLVNTYVKEIIGVFVEESAEELCSLVSLCVD